MTQNEDGSTCIETKRWGLLLQIMRYGCCPSRHRDLMLQQMHMLQSEEHLTLTEACSTLSRTVCRKSPAAYLASVRANADCLNFFPISSLVWTIVLRIWRKRMVKASAFFLRREWPFTAPESLDFMTARTETVGTTLSLLPEPDILLGQASPERCQNYEFCFEICPSFNGKVRVRFEASSW